MLLSKIINTVAEFYSVSPDNIKGSSRKKEIVKARHVVCYLARKQSNQSYPKIGKALNERDHTTIINSFKKISLEISKDEDFKNTINCLLSFLKRGEDKESYNIVAKIPQKVEVKNEVKKKRIYKKFFSEEQLKRINIIVTKYRSGWTLEDISKEFKLTRERMRQIVMAGLAYEIQNSLKKCTEEEVENFIKKEKEQHFIEKKKRYGKKSSMPVIKEKKWSFNYEHCKRCGTVKVKHRSNGYCTWCYPKTEIFKKQQEESRLRNKKKRTIKQREYSREYLRRPEIREKLKIQNDLINFDGNREKAIKRDNFQCQKCGLSRKESISRLGRDLYVEHIQSGNGNFLENLVTVCKKCHNKKLANILHKNNKARSLIYA